MAIDVVTGTVDRFADGKTRSVVVEQALPAMSAHSSDISCGDTEAQLPTLLPLTLLDAAQSDNENDGEVDGHLRKARRVSCKESPPSLAKAHRLPPELAAALDARGVQYLSGPDAIAEHCVRVIAQEGTEDNFFVYDLGVVARLYTGFKQLMPRVAPCYAVKCNPNDGILATLAALGGGFDCASQAEMEQVMALGVGADRIIYAHPQKPPREIRWAAANGIQLTTFDTVSELQKLAQWHPTCGMLLRIRADDAAARCPLGNKYGAELEDVPALLDAARRLGLTLRGVSFHVGSGATNPHAFTAAIAAARHVFNLATELGFEMNVLDIGGGFEGGTFSPDGQLDMGGVPAAVNAALEVHFPDDGTGRLRIIAEPGRFFAEPTATMACFVNGWRERRTPGATDSLPCRDYWLTDGVYGSMNCLLYDHVVLAPRALRSPLLPPPEADGGELYPTTLFGPTCDGMDLIVRDHPMPKLRQGDWVIFPRFGAYTIAGAVNFNGFNVAGAAVHYVHTA